MSEENTTASEKRELIRDTIIDIRSKIPEGRVPEYLTNLLEKIPYMAPEILGNSWTKLHNILQTHIPISKDSENPPLDSRGGNNVEWGSRNIGYGKVLQSIKTSA